MGRPSFEPTDEEKRLVEACAGFGVPEDEILTLILRKGVPIAKNTLRKHFKTELESAHTRANLRVAQSLYNQAISGNTTAAIFWMKTRAGWREKVSMDHTSSDRSMSPMTLDELYGKLPDPKSGA